MTRRTTIRSKVWIRFTPSQARLLLQGWADPHVLRRSAWLVCLTAVLVLLGASLILPGSLAGESRSEASAIEQSTSPFTKLGTAAIVPVLIASAGLSQRHLGQPLTLLLTGFTSGFVIITALVRLPGWTRPDPLPLSRRRRRALLGVYLN